MQDIRFPALIGAAVRLALLAVLCAACGPDLADVPRVQRPRTTAARSWTVAPTEHLARLTVPEGLAPWSAQAEEWRTEVLPEARGGARMLVLKSEAMRILRIPLPVEARGLNGVRFLTSARKNVSIGVELRSEGRFLTRTPYRLVLADSAPQTVEIDVPSARFAPSPPDELVLRFGGGEREARLWGLELLRRPWEEWAAERSVPGARPVIGDVAREAAALATDNPRRADFTVPERGRLSLHYAVLPGLSVAKRPAELVVSVEHSGGVLSERRVVDKPARGAERWQHVELDLAPLAGTRVRLVVELRSQSRHVDYALVTTPTVHVPTDAPRTALLVTSDTHRADHVASAGDAADVFTPVLDALAARGVSFDDCYSSTNITLPSHVALLTGVPPRDSGVLNNLGGVSAEARTLADRYRELGWATFAATSSAILQDSWSGLGGGFDAYSAPSGPARDGEETVAEALLMLDEASDRDAFVWIHLFDAHRPYDERSPFLHRYWPEGQDPRADGDPGYPPEILSREYDVVVVPEYLDAGYKAEVSYADHSLAAAFDHPRLADAWTVVTADHGECLGEHEVWWNHEGLFHQNLHVPLILAGPGVPRGVRVSGPVEHLDVGRTLLDLSGHPEASFPGRSLLRHLEQEPEPDAPRFALSNDALAASVRVGRWHCVLQLRPLRLQGHRRPRPAHSVALYDLGTGEDPLRDVAHENVERASALRARILDWLTQRREIGWGRGGDGDPDRERTVRALGYTGEADEGSSVWIDADCACEPCRTFGRD